MHWFRLILKAAAVLIVFLCCLVVVMLVWRFNFSLAHSERQAQLYGWSGVVASLLSMAFPFWLFRVGRKIAIVWFSKAWTVSMVIGGVLRSILVLLMVPVWLIWLSYSLTASLAFSEVIQPERTRPDGSMSNFERRLAKMHYIEQQLSFLPKTRNLKDVKEVLQRLEQTGVTQEQCLPSIHKLEKGCQDRAVLLKEQSTILLKEKFSQNLKSLMLGDDTVASELDKIVEENAFFIQPGLSKKERILLVIVTILVQLLAALAPFLLFGNKRLRPLPIKI